MVVMAVMKVEIPVEPGAATSCLMNGDNDNDNQEHNTLVLSSFLLLSLCFEALDAIDRIHHSLCGLY